MDEKNDQAKLSIIVVVGMQRKSATEFCGDRSAVRYGSYRAYNR